MKVFKYSIIVLSDVVQLSMPLGAKPLCVQVQNGIPCMWALVDEENALVDKKFRIYGTGHPVDPEYTDYIGTFQIDDGRLVFHVFGRKGSK